MGKKDNKKNEKPTVKSENTTKQKQENKVLEAINNVNPDETLEKVVSVPDETPENEKTDTEIVISEANDILDNTETIEDKIEDDKENIKETIEEEIKKVEKVVEKGKNILKERKNNNYTFTEFWNGTTMY